MSDYERIAVVIRYLDEHHADQPDLGELADATGLSPSHLHRLFHRWAGITPKDFLQCLTLEHAKQRLRESASVLDTALDAGLSGPGRLHDLLVTIDSASPGEIKSGGAGLNIDWGLTDSPFGPCTIAWTARGICHLAFCDDANLEHEPVELRKDWPSAEFRRSDSAARRQAGVIFHQQNGDSITLKAFVRGTSFQLKVWRALLHIPEGSLSTYSALARAIGNSQAARAVGTACGSNPIAYLIPCHRVIRETGVIQGYRWGKTRKQAMLAQEGARTLQISR